MIAIKHTLVRKPFLVYTVVVGDNAFVAVTANEEVNSCIYRLKHGASVFYVSQKWKTLIPDETIQNMEFKDFVEKYVKVVATCEHPLSAYLIAQDHQIELAKTHNMISKNPGSVFKNMHVWTDEEIRTLQAELDGYLADGTRFSDAWYHLCQNHKDMCRMRGLPGIKCLHIEVKKGTDDIQTDTVKR